MLVIVILMRILIKDALVLSPIGSEQPSVTAMRRVVSKFR
jgi:hypothetical protein